jgi:hypothetical protein
VRLEEFDIGKYVKENMLLGNYDNTLSDKKDSREDGLNKQVKKILSYFYEANKNNLFMKEPDFFLRKEKNASSEASKYQKDKNRVEEWHVFNAFPLKWYEEDEVKIFLNHVFELKKEVSSKVVSNLDKINVDEDLSYFYKGTKQDSIYKSSVGEKIIRNREIIRKEPDSRIHELLENLGDVTEVLINDKNYSNLSLFADYTTDIILQALNYWVVTIEGKSKKSKVEILDAIYDYVRTYKSEVYTEDIVNIKHMNNIDINEAIAIFSEFLQQRNNFGEYVNILDMLNNEQKEENDLFGEVQAKYSIKKRTYIDDVTKIREIITEGKIIDNREYEQKLHETKDMIDVFSVGYGRNASNKDLFDLKVYYRELFISNSRYKHQAMSIAREYLKIYRETGDIDSFGKKSEYMFVREKINRGNFRETGDLDLYEKKNMIQREVYQVFLLMYLVYDYDKSLKLMYSLTFVLTRDLFRNLQIM